MDVFSTRLVRTANLRDDKNSRVLSEQSQRCRSTTNPGVSSRFRSKWPSWAGYILLLGAATLYWFTLDNGLQPGELVGGDLITHQYAQVQARPSNAPGYPLYTMGGWLWFHGLRSLARLWGDLLPNPIPILSSYSTLWALSALWLFYRILCHITRSPVWPQGNWPLSWLLSAFYAVTYFFWYYATTTEQYSSAVAQTLAIVYVYLLWREAWVAHHKSSLRHPEITTARQDAAFRLTPSSLAGGYLLLLAFLCGVSLAHMLTVAFIAPPLVAVLLWEAPQLMRSVRMILGVVAAAGLPLLSYLYVYLRGAVHPEWWGAGDWGSAREWFWDFVSTAQGRAELGWGFEAGRPFLGNQFPELIWQELSIPLFAVGLIGIAWSGRKLAVLLYSTLAIYLLFCWAYRYGNWFQVILPAYPLVLTGVAALSSRLLDVTATHRSHREWRTMHYLVGIILIILVVGRAASSLPAADSRNQPDDTAFARAAGLLAQPLPPNASLFAELNDLLALQYLIHIWQIRPDLQTINSPEAAEALAQGQPVFATWQAAPILRSELPQQLVTTMQSAGPDWIRLDTSLDPPEVAPKAVVERTVTPQLSLYGYDIQPAPPAHPDPNKNTPALDVTLYWRIWDNDWPEDLALSIRPTLDGAFVPDPQNPAGIVQQDAVRPAHGLLSLAGLPPGAPVADAYRFPLPSPSGANGLLVVLYRRTADGFENVAEISLP
jgi:hypothetical protein